MFCYREPLEPLFKLHNNLCMTYTEMISNFTFFAFIIGKHGQFCTMAEDRLDRNTLDGGLFPQMGRARGLLKAINKV